jgi:hypothetical protein
MRTVGAVCGQQIWERRVAIQHVRVQLQAVRGLQQQQGRGGFLVYLAQLVPLQELKGLSVERRNLRCVIAVVVVTGHLTLSRW